MSNETTKNSARGFSMIEIVVVLALVVAISAIILFNFTGLNESAALNRSVRELALSARRAQNMALAVTRVAVGSPSVNRIPPAVGVRLSAGGESYFLFVDLESDSDPQTTTRDSRYTPALNEKIGGDEVFERNIKVGSFKNENGAAVSTPVIHLVFAAPEAALTLTDENGNSIGNHVVIELVPPSGSPIKTVTVRTSGQISIK